MGKIENGVATCVNKIDNTVEEMPLDDIVAVAQFGEAIYPYLKPIDSVCNAPNSDLWHALIEADNYHALQLLEYLYAGKVDCIYIDPPYNTGAKDWKYNNDYVDGADVYRHSKWLSMMDKRLRLAKKLLNPKSSVLIVTIDEKEYLHLGCLLEEIFPSANMQMVSDVIHPSGVARTNQFSRVNMGTWSKRVPTDERIYEKHESVPNNPKIADVSFRSGDVESWGRGFLKIKAECNAINAPLPVIDAEYGGVSVSAVGCEKYMSLLRYGQYGQVGVDGVWRDKEQDDKKTSDKKVNEDTNLIQKSERSLKEVLKEVLSQKDYEKTLPIIEYLEANPSITTQKAKQITGKSLATAWRYLQILVKVEILESDGNTNNAEYVLKEQFM